MILGPLGRSLEGLLGSERPWLAVRRCQQLPSTLRRWHLASAAVALALLRVELALPRLALH